MLDEQGIDATRGALPHRQAARRGGGARALPTNARLVVTVEEGVAIGGFGSAVTDFLVRSSGQSLPAMMRLGLPDVFPQKYGSQDDHFEIYGLMPHQIASPVSKALGKPSWSRSRAANARESGSERLACYVAAGRRRLRRSARRRCVTRRRRPRRALATTRRPDRAGPDAAASRPRPAAGRLGAAGGHRRGLHLRRRGAARRCAKTIPPARR